MSPRRIARRGSAGDAVMRPAARLRTLQLLDLLAVARHDLTRPLTRILGLEAVDAKRRQPADEGDHDPGFAHQPRLIPASGSTIRNTTTTATTKMMTCAILVISGSGENRWMTHHAQISTAMMIIRLTNPPMSL